MTISLKGSCVKNSTESSYWSGIQLLVLALYFIVLTHI